MQHNITAPSSAKTSQLPIALQLGTAMALGIALFMLVGFAPMEAVHNAAHDARHAFAFPCH